MDLTVTQRNWLYAVSLSCLETSVVEVFQLATPCLVVFSCEAVAQHRLTLWTAAAFVSLAKGGRPSAVPLT